MMSELTGPLRVGLYPSEVESWCATAHAPPWCQVRGQALCVYGGFLV